MSIRELIAKAGRAGPSGARKGPAGPPVGPPFAGLGRLGSLGRYGIDAGLAQEQYQHNSGYVYSIIRTIANRIIGQPIHHARKLSGDRKPDKRHRAHMAHKDAVPDFLKAEAASGTLQNFTQSPILAAFRDPNPIMVSYTVMFNTVASLELTGKAFWWLRWGPGRKPEIWPLPSHWVQPVHTPTLFSSWVIEPGGGADRFSLPANDVCYFYYPDPSDPLSAYAPLTALAKTVMADESMEESVRRTFLNTMSPGLAITIGQSAEDSPTGQETSPVLTRAQRRALKTILKDEYRGVINSGEPMILDGFIKGVAPIFPAPKELDYLNSGQATKGRLAQGWGVNPISMGEVEGANRASSAVADDHLINNVVNPRISMMSQIMTCWLPRFFSGRRDEAVYIQPASSKDIDYELNRDTQMVDRGAKSLNEWREGHGMGPIKNGDRAFIPAAATGSGGGDANPDDPDGDSSGGDGGGGWVDVEAENDVSGGKPSGAKGSKATDKVFAQFVDLLNKVRDDNGQEHAADGKFGTGSGSGGGKDDAKENPKGDAKEDPKDKPKEDPKEDTGADERSEAEQAKIDKLHEKWSAEDYKVIDRRDTEDEKLSDRRDTEDEKHADKFDKETEKIDAKNEKEDDKLSTKREKEDAAIEKRREKEDAAAAKRDEQESQESNDLHDAENDRIETARTDAHAEADARHAPEWAAAEAEYEKTIADTQAARDADTEAAEARHGAELEEQEITAEKEGWDTAKCLAVDQETAQRHAAELAAIEAKHDDADLAAEAKKDAVAERHEAEKTAIEEKYDALGEANDAAFEARETAREEHNEDVFSTAREKEDADLEAVRAAEDEAIADARSDAHDEREAAFDAAAAERKAARDKEDADIKAARDKEDHDDYRKRREQHEDAHAEFYDDTSHRQFGGDKAARLVRRKLAKRRTVKVRDDNGANHDSDGRFGTGGGSGGKPAEGGKPAHGHPEGRDATGAREGAKPGERNRIVDRTTTHEGVKLDHAKKLSAEEAKQAVAWHDGMTQVGDNGKNKKIPDAGRPELSDGERGALQKYSYKNDRVLNAHLRGDDTAIEKSPYNDKFYTEMNAQMQSAFDKAKVLDKPITVVRGMNVTDPARLESLIGGMENAMKNGGTVKFDGYTSTAAPGGLAYKLGLDDGIPKAFKGNVSLKINAVHGLDMSPHSQLPGEKEFLLNHATQFRVKSVTKKNGSYHVELDQIPPEKHGKGWTGCWKGKDLDTGSGDFRAGLSDEERKLLAFYAKNPDAAKKWQGTAAGIKFRKTDKRGLELPPKSVAAGWGIKATTRHFRDMVDEHRKRLTDVLCGTLSGLGSQAVREVRKYRGHDAAAAVQHAIDVQKWEAAIKAAVEDTLAHAARSGASGEWVVSQPRKEAKAGLPGRLLRAVAGIVGDLIGGKAWSRLVARIATAARKAIGSALSAGHDPGDAAASVLTEPLSVAAHAEKAADVEAAAAVNGGRHAAFDHLLSVGKVVARRWMTCRDGRVRDSHQRAHGQVARGSAPFIVGGEECAFPGDPILSASQRCRCRCVAISISG